MKGGGEEPTSVAALTARLRGTLEREFPAVFVRGEISGWSVAQSGHAYFTLKDASAALGCVMWKGTRAGLAFAPADGMQVDARGGISVFEKRGQYQLTVSSLRRAGEGDLWRRFLELKERLEREGLFDPGRKRALPELPRAVGVVTSPGGAVIHDIAKVLSRRAPWLPVYVAAARVQGAGAAEEVRAGIEFLAGTGLVDVVIVARGGGSMEDLWEFNSEVVARAVVASPIPVVSAVGHETDFTICDFASDLRAPTPSAAAELVSAGHVEVSARVAEGLRAMERHVVDGLRDRRRKVESLLGSHALESPVVRLREAQQRLDHAARRLPAALDLRLERVRSRLRALEGALTGHDPELILKKGYAIVRREKSGAIVRDAERVRPGVVIRAQIAEGELRARVLPAPDSQGDLFGKDAT